MNDRTATLEYLSMPSDTPTERQVSFTAPSGLRITYQPKKKIKNAVYSYIRAVRALGHKKVKTSQIAEALSVSIADVERAIALLRKKGVRVQRGI